MANFFCSVWYINSKFTFKLNIIINVRITSYNIIYFKFQFFILISAYNNVKISIIINLNIFLGAVL